MSKYVTRIDESFSSNPWTNDLAITIKTGSKITAMGRTKRVVDVNTGELEATDVAMVSKKIVDREEFVKLFEGGISNLFDLSKAARDLFKAILTLYLNQKMVGDKIYISEVALKEVGYERTRVTRNNAINQLLKSGFIAKVKGENNWFWVNPNMFYKGDRLTLVQQFSVKGTEAAKQMEQEIHELEQKTKQKELELTEEKK